LEGSTRRIEESLGDGLDEPTNVIAPRGTALLSSDFDKNRQKKKGHLGI
jgi:hypothetical protein